MSENEKRTEEAVQKLQAKKEKAAAIILQNYPKTEPEQPKEGIKEQAVPPPTDVQLKELTENFDGRLTAMEDQLPLLLNHRHAKSGVVIIFDKTKEKK